MFIGGKPSDLQSMIYVAPKSEKFHTSFKCIVRIVDAISLDLYDILFDGISFNNFDQIQNYSDNIQKKIIKFKNNNGVNKSLNYKDNLQGSKFWQ